MKNKINIYGQHVTTISKNGVEYFNLSDIIKVKHSNQKVKDFLYNKKTLEFIGSYEKKHNSDFNFKQYIATLFKTDIFTPKKRGGEFTPALLTLCKSRVYVSDLNKLGVKCLFSLKGRYQGTYATAPIVYLFASWISSDFHVYVYDKFSQFILKESSDIRNNIARLNRVMTDAIKARIGHKSEGEQKAIYLTEMDVLNKIAFGTTASAWRRKNPNLKGNLRDYRSNDEVCKLEKLILINTSLIEGGLLLDKRIELLKQVQF